MDQGESMRQNTTPSQEIQQPDPVKKKPYVKPAFRMEKVFETQALACGKLTGTQQTCRSAHKSS